MNNQTMHKGKKLHYMIRDFKKNIVRCIQKDCKKDHPKSLMITLSCGCQKVFNDKVLGWTSMYNIAKCKTGRHKPPSMKHEPIQPRVLP